MLTLLAVLIMDFMLDNSTDLEFVVYMFTTGLCLMQDIGIIKTLFSHR